MRSEASPPCADECACCGAQESLEKDHMIPKSNGGSDARENRQMLCRRCNLSKLDGPSCRISHSLDVMRRKPEMEQLPRENGDGGYQARKMSRESHIKGPNPQVNWRVQEDIKTEIEEQAKRRGVGAGEIIKELWRSQHAEILNLLAELLHRVPDPSVSSRDRVSPPESPRVLDDPMEVAPTVETPSYQGWTRRFRAWSTR